MVTGASGVIGRSLVPLLAARDEVRACVRRADAADPLRAEGAKVAIGRSDDSDALAEILKGVYTVVHLVGGSNQPDIDQMLAANHGSVLTALAAAREAKVRRFILVSVPGASVDAAHPYLRAKGLAEEAVVNSGLEHAIVRSTHAYGLGGLWFTSLVEGALTVPPFVVGSGDQIMAPVLADDLAAVIVAADDHVGDLCGTWALEGPDALSAAELVGRLTPTGVEPVPVPADAAAARLTERLGATVSVLASEFFALPSRADAPDAASAFGVERTPFDEGLRRTTARATAAGR
jgi:NADH dehydrogenase